jgi:hypothetical protein
VKELLESLAGRESCEEAGVVWIDYTNWRGNRSWRRIRLKRIVLEATFWHGDLQWLLVAQDLDKQSERYFALACIHEWSRVDRTSEGDANVPKENEES